MFDTLTSVLGLIGTITGIVAGIVGTVVGLRNLRRTRQAKESAQAAEQSSRVAAGEASATGETVTALTEALTTMKETHDELFAAFLSKESTDLRLKRIEQYLHDHETEKRSTRHAAAFPAPIFDREQQS